MDTVDKPAGSILERAARSAAGAPPAPAAGGGSLLERAQGRAADPGPRAPSYAETQARGPSAIADADPPFFKPAAGMAKQSRVGTIALDRLREEGFVIPDAPANLTAEEFRLVKRQLLSNAFLRGPDAIKNGNLILVGSALPNEGKTFCAINLALSLAAERDLTVLLVDADFGKPEIVQRLGLEAGPGLIDVVADRSIDLGDCMIRTQIPNLTVLPAGRRHNMTTELLASERMGDMIQEVARRYTDRIVVFDSPPALVSSAASTLAMHVGQVVFVVAAETTREGELREALALMGGCENVQLLLNRSRFAPGQRRFATYYNYGS